MGLGKKFHFVLLVPKNYLMGVLCARIRSLYVTMYHRDFYFFLKKVKNKTQNVRGEQNTPVVRLNIIVWTRTKPNSVQYENIPRV